MNNPVTTFNMWILSKVSRYLRLKEGCELTDTIYTLDGCRATVTDAFGFRYEISIRTIGRISSDGTDLPQYKPNTGKIVVNS